MWIGQAQARGQDEPHLGHLGAGQGVDSGGRVHLGHSEALAGAEAVHGAQVADDVADPGRMGQRHRHAQRTDDVRAGVGVAGLDVRHQLLRRVAHLAADRAGEAVGAQLGDRLAGKVELARGPIHQALEGMALVVADGHQAALVARGAQVKVLAAQALVPVADHAPGLAAVAGHLPELDHSRDQRGFRCRKKTAIIAINKR